MLGQEDYGLTLGLSINGHRTRVATVVELQRELESFAGEAFREVWIDVQDGPALCAVFNGSVGWLMYIREDGDAGFSSRNPDYQGTIDAVLEYRLSNGQRDVYPAGWALPETQIMKALEFFVEFRQQPSFIQWHDDGA
jgi:Immunity protein Imm1